jgi:L-ascorbate peroxidase
MQYACIYVYVCSYVVGLMCEYSCVQAGAVAVEHALGPKIPMKYGRLDALSEEDCAPPGNLPAAAHPYPRGASTAQQHLRDTFHRMGLDDRDIVALR